MCLVCSIRHWRGLCRLTQAGSWVGSWGVRHSSSYPGAVALGRRLWHLWKLWKLWQLGGQAQLIVPRCCCTWQASMASMEAMEAMAAGGSGTAHRTPVLLHLAGVYGIYGSYGSYGSWGVRHSSSYPGAVALGRRLWHLWKLWQLGGQAQLIVPRCCCTWQASMASMEAMAAGGSGTAHRTPVLLHLAGVYGIYGSYGSWGVRHSSSYPGAVALGRRLWHLWKLWQLGGQAPGVLHIQGQSLHTSRDRRGGKAEAGQGGSRGRRKPGKALSFSKALSFGKAPSLGRALE